MRLANRHLLQEIATWAALALSVVACIHYFPDLKRFLAQGGAEKSALVENRSGPARAGRPDFSGEVHLKADRRGHFVVEGAVDGRPLTFMADTGASLVALTYEDAKRAGLAPQTLDFTARVSTANGVALVAPVTLGRVRIGTITLRNVPAAVAEKGALGTNLLGMSFLGRLKSFNLRGNELILVQ